VEDNRYWIALNLVPGIGSVSYRNLIGVFHGPRQVFKASPKGLGKVEGIGPKLAEAILSFPLEKRLRDELRLMDRYGVSAVTYREPGYPRILLEIFDPPPVLYVRGSLEAAGSTAVAIVGSRRATAQGRAFTEQLARDLAAQGVTVVSGMARGIDSAAHRGALLGGGKTLAVLGCGVDVVYPAENRGLMREIVERGGVISEFPMGTGPLPGNFPRRNRIISGLVAGVVVVEANFRSGSLITADYALEQGREVFAVPGSVRLPHSRGTHRLIKQGAKLVERAEDVLEEILPRWQHRDRKEGNEEIGPVSTLTDEERFVYGLLGDEPLHIDHLVIRTGWQANRVSRVLLDLELTGLISQLPGKRFVRV